MRRSRKISLLGSALFGLLVAVGTFFLDWNLWSCALALVIVFSGWLEGRAAMRAEIDEGTS